MSGRPGKAGYKRKRKPSLDEEKDEKDKSKYEDIFMSFKRELNARYDTQERLVKLSRDVTIQSKRVIFNLHQFSGTSEESKQKVLKESEKKIQEDIVPKLYSIALELMNRDPNEFMRSYSYGMQEFIEAYTFLHYLRSGRLVSYNEVQTFLTFKAIIEEPKEQEKQENSANGALTKKMILPLSYGDFLLGIADLTGELMRLCINAVGSGNDDLPFHLLSFMRTTWRGFLGIGIDNVKYLSQKMTVMQASLCKVENVCYAVKIRRLESPHLGVLTSSNVLENTSEEQ